MGYKITYRYYDGSVASEAEFGYVKERDLDAFVVHLETCGYKGHMGENVGCFSATIDPGDPSHYGLHNESFHIQKTKRLKTLSPKRWGCWIMSLPERGYVKKAGNVEVWTEVKEPNQTEDDDEFEVLLNDFDERLFCEEPLE